MRKKGGKEERGGEEKGREGRKKERWKKCGREEEGEGIEAAVFETARKRGDGGGGCRL